MLTLLSSPAGRLSTRGLVTITLAAVVVVLPWRQDHRPSLPGQRPSVPPR
jgi:hypothetical protein